MAAFNVHVELIQKLWYLAKELKLTPEELKNGLLFQKSSSVKRPGIWKHIIVLLM
jgi:hypothetical protein